MKWIFGISLIEILVVLLLCTSAFSFFSPGFINFYERIHTNTGLQSLQAILYYAQQQALSSGKSVTVCADDGTEHCQHEWHEDLLVKMDDKVLRHVHLPVEVTYDGFPNSDSLTFLPSGFTQTQNGRFLFSTGKEKLELLVSQTGRMRVEKVAV